MNQVASDGMSDNVAILRIMAIHKSKEVCPGLNTKLPGDILVTFVHPLVENTVVFIGWEITHWINRLVNRLEMSSKTAHKTYLVLKGKPLGLGMIEKAWETVKLGGI